MWLAAGTDGVTGESLLPTMFTRGGQGKAKVAFAAPYPGTVMPMKLSEHGGRLVCQKDSFLAGARGVSVGIHFQRKILTGLFGGAGFILQKPAGDRCAFLPPVPTVNHPPPAPAPPHDPHPPPPPPPPPPHP